MKTILNEINALLENQKSRDLAMGAIQNETQKKNKSELRAAATCGVINYTFD